MAKKQVSEKALQDALKSLTKSFGSAYDSRGLCEDFYEAIPTGYDDLDAVLTNGNNGIFLGGVVEIFGSEGSGKCLTEDSLCLTPKGLMTVREIFEDADLSCEISRGFIEKEYTLINGDLEEEKTSHFYKNGCASSNLKTVVIETGDGFRLEGTYNHPVRIIDENGFLVWRKLSEIKDGDQVCIYRNTNVWNKNSSISIDESRLLGFWIGDGNFTTPHRIGFSCACSETFEFYEKCLASVFPVQKQKIKKYGIDYHINDVSFVKEVHDKYGLEYVKSCDKEIPFCIRTSSKESQMAFISSYWECDGTIQLKKMNMQFASCSLQLLRQLQIMLLNFGIYSHITSQFDIEYDKDYYELEFAGKEVLIYMSQIGFLDTPKSRRAVEAITKYKSSDIEHNTNNDTIPNLNSMIKSLYSSICPDNRDRVSYAIFADVISNRCDVTYKRLLNIITWCNNNEVGNKCILSHLNKLCNLGYIYSRVNKTETSSNKTYDFTLPKTKSFLANGFINHNTSVAMRTVGKAQEIGLHCCWLDAEFGFSPDLAILNGVDVKKLVMPNLSEVDTKSGGLISAAEILNMMQETIQRGVFSIVVLDSVAGLIPLRSIEAEDPNKPQVAELARTMSEQVRKIKAICNKTNTTAIFINQIRMKPGDIYHPETTPGGKALDFYSDHRIRVEKINGKSGQVLMNKTHDITGEEFEDVIGHYARTWVVKNRKAKPCQEALQIPIYYEHYFPDNAKKCYDMARILQVITINRGTLTWKRDKAIIIQKDGEADILNAIRDEKKINELAYDCVMAEIGERNQNKKQPTKVPPGIKKLSDVYKIKLSKPQSKQSKSKGKDVIGKVTKPDIDLDE